MTVTSQWVGAITPSSVRVVAKITGTTATLKYATNSSLTGATTTASVTAVDSIVTFDVSGLVSNTRYFYAVDDAGVGETGQFLTHPPLGSQASYTFAVSSCAGAGAPLDVQGAVLDPIHVSNHPVFDTIRNRALSERWAWFTHLGDFHYYNLGGPAGKTSGDATVVNYRRGYDDVLLQPRQQALYRDVALTLTWDDHDSGPNNGDSTSPGMQPPPDEAIGPANQVFRERVPAYTLPANGIYQSWQVGRVLYVQTDTRTFRTPNSAPDDATKTMLGGAQKAWFSNLLQTSTAEALVWLCATPWMLGAGSDTWSGFQTEANELVEMFSRFGWLDRMICVSGDTHYMAIDDGTGVSIGGIPLFLYGSLDSSGGGTSSLPWSHGMNGGKNRYGTIAVVDNGNQIHLTGTGWIGSEMWQAYTVTVLARVVPGPPPEPVVEEPLYEGVAERRLSVTWYGCDLISGQIIAELPEMRGTVSRVIGQVTSAGLTLPIPHGGPGSFTHNGQPLPHVWEQATTPGQTMIVPVVNDIPAAGFIVLDREGGVESDLRLSCASLEAYLDRRYVANHTWVNQDEASVIAAGLLADANLDGIGLTINAPATGTLRERTYVDQDDVTVLQRLTELMEVEDGPEWTIDVDWADAKHNAVRKIAKVRKRIGIASTRPHAVFSTEGGSDTTYTFKESYTSGKGANVIVATSSGEGESRPQSRPIGDVLFGWPRWELRYSPGSSITSVGVLTSHALNELALRRDGAKTWTFSSRWGAYPRLNVDCKLGDDIGWDVTGPRHPYGAQGVGRMIGWSLDIAAGLFEPILLEVE